MSLLHSAPAAVDPGVVRPDWLLAALAAALVVALATGVRYHARTRHLGRARSDFVTAVSHDLRTPVAQIRLLSETLLLDETAGGDQRVRWVASIAREAQVLEDRIASILLFAHGDGLSSTPPREPVVLDALVEDVVAEYTPVADVRGMYVRADAEPGLAARGDARALRLALVNLLDNALRYGPAGQTVTVSLRARGRDAVLAVADGGPGLPPHVGERIWEPFVRHDCSPGSAGSGLGLSVVRRVAALHRGRAFVHPGQGGACVCFSVPLSAPSPQ